MTRAGSFRSALVPLVLLANVTLLTVPAVAEGMSQNHSSGPVDVGGGGKQYTVRITYTGDVKGSGGGSGGSRVVEAPVPVKCWWAPAASFYRDPRAMYDFYMDLLDSHSTSQYASERMGSPQDYQDVIDKAAAGQKYYWYRASCRDDADLAGFTHDSIGSVNVLKAFPVRDGEARVPVPRVDPEQVAVRAFEVLDLVDPVLDRNPRAGGGTGAGWTVVNVPTWFWVTNARALGGPEGTRTVTAQVEQPGGRVLRVVLTARTRGLALSSPAAGSVSCPPARAAVAWARGLEDSRGCTLQFRRASVGHPDGYPVTASVTWNATWTSPQDPVEHPVPDGTRTLTTTVPVPVAEIQTLVTELH